jgi:tetratricopeptide (TPR) repeat protein
MGRADEAFAARRVGNHERAAELFRQAFEQEREAAGLVADDPQAVLTRAVLYRSAATLAMDCGELDEAESLIKTALQGSPPAEVAKELRDLRKRVRSAARQQQPAAIR